MKTCAHLWYYLAESSSNEKCFRQICRENQNTCFMFKNFFPENRVIYVEKYGSTRQATDDNIMRIACWINKATDTRRVCNTYCFFTARTVKQKRLSTLSALFTLDFVTWVLFSGVYRSWFFSFLDFPLSPVAASLYADKLFFRYLAYYVLIDCRYNFKFVS
jgi:hypothetical protein